MSSPRILFLTRKFPPSRGGMETFSYELTSRYPGESIVQHYGHKQRDIIWVAPLLLLTAIRKRKQVDIIHLGDLVLAPIAPWIKRFTKLPVVATAHALELTHQSTVLKRLIDRGLPAIDHIVAVSDYSASLLQKRGIAETRISVITHGVRTPTIGEHENSHAALCDALQLTSEDRKRPLLLTVGRLVRRKGVHWFIHNVLDTLKEYHPLYLIASDGPERTRLEELAKSRDDIRLLGKVDDELLELLYNGSEIFVMPNIDEDDDAEGFGFVAIEAAIRGLPVVASRLEGIPSAIHDGKNGTLLTPGDAQAYTDTLTQWLKNPEERTSFSRSAREYTIAHFDWDDRVTEYQELFTTLTR